MNSRKTYFIIGVLLLAILIIALLVVKREPTPYQRSILAHRTKVDNFFKQDKRSPLLDPDKEKFKGLTYFEPDSAFRILATFTRDTTPQFMPSKADSVVQVRAGTVSFQFEDKTYTLTAYWQRLDSEKELFIPFRDATSGKTTYGGGRFLNATLNQDFKTLFLDFNFAYNPYCAYNPSYVCPIPPPENTLEFEVNAGENGFTNLKP